MIALKMPFNYVNGSTSDTYDYFKIIEQKIVNFMVTNYGERVMRPNYGGNAYNMLFEPVSDLIWADYRATVLSEIGRVVSGVQIVDIVIKPEAMPYMGDAWSSVQVNVQYRLPSSNAVRTLDVTLTENG
jgi:hypothetical protein